MEIYNPIIPGFNPDPSFLCVGEDYYIATSTFEWFPGICIHHSKDLANWEIAAYALTNETMLDLKGIDASCGIWAPNLTWCDGLFYLAYTIVYTNRSRFKDTYNFLVTAKDIHGPWSKPTPLSRSGFDPSIFHDTDGAKYLVNMTMDHRPDTTRFSGIDVQEYDHKSGRLVGQPMRVFKGTKFGMTEGPNIMKKDGWYYLVMAEGGTEFFHCATVVRSRSIWGPYEESPYNPLITSYGQKDCRLARAGHAQIIRGHDDSWYMAHLCSRPVDECSIMGRESAIQNVMWTDDGWPRLQSNEQGMPEDVFQVPWNVKQIYDHSQYVDFSIQPIPLDYMTLRQGHASCGIRLENGALVIRGGCSPLSRFEQGFLARRQQSLNCDFSTLMAFEPMHLNHQAGLMVYYNCDNHYHLKMTRDENGKYLCISCVINMDMTNTVPVYLDDAISSVWLKARIRSQELQYLYSLDGKKWLTIGEILDMRNISDERIAGNGFTGSMLGVHCCDCQGDGIEARFSFVDYREKDTYD